jgi:hypothetical protein
MYPGGWHVESDPQGNFQGARVDVVKFGLQLLPVAYDEAVLEAPCKVGENNAAPKVERRPPKVRRGRGRRQAWAEQLSRTPFALERRLANVIHARLYLLVEGINDLVMLQ